MNVNFLMTYSSRIKNYKISILVYLDNKHYVHTMVDCLEATISPEKINHFATPFSNTIWLKLLLKLEMQFLNFCNSCLQYQK